MLIILEVKRPVHQPWCGVFLGKDANQCQDLVSQDKSLHLLLQFPGPCGNSSANSRRWWWAVLTWGVGVLLPNLLQAHHQEVHPDPPLQIPLGPQTSTTTAREREDLELQILARPQRCHFLPRRGKAGPRMWPIVSPCYGPGCSREDVYFPLKLEFITF